LVYAIFVRKIALKRCIEMKTKQEIKEKIKELRRENYYWENHAGDIHMSQIYENNKAIAVLRWVLGNKK